MTNIPHIALTAAAVAMWRLPRGACRQALVVALLPGVVAFLSRLAAHEPDLNDDGPPGFSANGWASPIPAYLVVSGCADLRHAEPDRHRQVRARITVSALTADVITI